MVVNYIWNIELSETLYPILQVLEVALRNGTHAAASTAYGTEFWFDQPGVLLYHQAQEVADVKAKLIADHKQATAGRIVAQLMFGFWTRLLNRPYEASFWHANNLAILLAAFPSAPRRYRNRLDIWHRVNAIRDLRNRVFHYEPIWDRPTLTQEHANILQAISWISTEMRGMVGLCDRFQLVYQVGKTDVEARIKNHLGIP